MRRYLLIALLCLSLVTARADSEEEEEEEDIYMYADEVEERAFLVAQQKILETEVSDGTNVTVVLTLYNAGTRAAANVIVEDSELPPGVELLFANDSKTPVEKLSPGLSVVYRKVVRPTTTGMMLLQPAKMKYAPAVGSSEEQIGFSTAASVVVMTTNEYIVTKILLMGSYLTLGLLNTREEWRRFGMIIAIFLMGFSGNYLWQKLTKARKDRMRRRAVEYIEKSK